MEQGALGSLGRAGEREANGEMPILKVRMLGEFSFQKGAMEISDGGNRSKKVWLLLAYMAFYRRRTVTPGELTTLLWGEGEKSANPMNALKTMFHRARACLDRLGGGLGRQIIVRQEGFYAWNLEIPMELDVDEFEALRQAGAEAADDETRLDCWTKALDIYKGDFLSKLAYEPWVAPMAAHYHNLYIQTALETAEMLEQAGRWSELEFLCRAALEHEPYLEDVYLRLMRALLQQEDRQGAMIVYEKMSELLLSAFGVMPSDELRALYREAARSLNKRVLSMEEMLEQLREPPAGGALFCDYDFFKTIYHSYARLMERSGDAAHLALVTAEAPGGGELPRRSLDRVMDNLQQLIGQNLRRGDVACRCGLAQFLLLLPQANYENSRRIADRITKAFARQYPHSPAVLRASVHPMQPPGEGA